MPLREFFKSKKRKANEAAISDAVKKGEGTVQVTARRVDNPASSGKRLVKRGGSVTVGKKTTKIGERTVKDPDKTKYKVKMTTPKPVFKVGDRSNLDGSITDRPTTEKLGKELKERPDKTKRRIKAQAEGKTSYDIGYDRGKRGRMEYSGRYEQPPSSLAVTKEVIPQSHKEPITKTEKTIVSKQPTKQKMFTMRTNRESDKQNKLKTSVMWNRKVKKTDPETGEVTRVNKPTKIFSVSRNTKTLGTKNKKHKRE
jgi:hypothetical protein